jgi:hypothetical protein
MLSSIRAAAFILCAFHALLLIARGKTEDGTVG